MFDRKICIKYIIYVHTFFIITYLKQLFYNTHGSIQYAVKYIFVKVVLKFDASKLFLRSKFNYVM